MRVMPGPRWRYNEDIPPWHKEVTPIKRCKRGIFKFQKSLYTWPPSPDSIIQRGSAEHRNGVAK